MTGIENGRSMWREGLPIVEMLLNLSQLLFDFLCGTRGIGPVESNPRRAILKPVRAVQRGK
jgi:hypothetical protein